MTVSLAQIQNVLTRTSGFLTRVTSHSLQPYRGCTFGHSLCGVGCYVRHSRHLLQGREWGDFLEVRENAAESYREHVARERRWARTRRERFAIFCSSATDPFVPQEARYHVTRSLLQAMLNEPPDLLILQTHSPRVADELDLLLELRTRCELRVHVSIETDRERLPGLPPPASTPAARMEACARLRQAGIRTVVTVAPLLPIESPATFFARLSEVADAVVIDHFIEGDGSRHGERTSRTPLPAAMEALEPSSLTLDYRNRMAEIAQQFFPGCVGINIDGFAGRYLKARD